MNKSISVKSIKWDIQEILVQSPYQTKHLGLIISVLLMLLIRNDFLEMLIFGLGILIAILWQFTHYLALKKKEKTKEVIFFKKKKNEQRQSLYIFLTMMFFAWLFRNNMSWFLFNIGVGMFFLAQYVFFIPSIVFRVRDYSLLIERGFLRSKIDFTYINKIRFVSNRMIFENVLDKKIEIKNIEYLSKMDDLKEFLSDNFGREKVVSASNGQPLI
jgi:hypothetical protein